VNGGRVVELYTVYLRILTLSGFNVGVVIDDVDDISVGSVESVVRIDFVRDVDSHPVPDTKLLHTVLYRIFDVKAILEIIY